MMTDAFLAETPAWATYKVVKIINQYHARGIAW